VRFQPLCACLRLGARDADPLDLVDSELGFGPGVSPRALRRCCLHSPELSMFMWIRPDTYKSGYCQLG
jgi:hypothetical protein